MRILVFIADLIEQPKAEPFKRWLARAGAERLGEIEAPERATDRMRTLYRQRGYSEEWIRVRLQSIVTRDELTAEWRERGAQEGRKFAILTDLLHHGTFDANTAEHKTIKALKSRDSLRDSMTPLELALTILSETTATALHQAHDSQAWRSCPPMRERRATWAAPLDGMLKRGWGGQSRVLKTARVSPSRRSVSHRSSATPPSSISKLRSRVSANMADL